MRRRRHDRERGAAAVEFALLVPALLVLALGIMEFGWAFMINANLAGAAREAAREMAITQDQPAARTAAINAATTTSLTAGQITISPDSCTGGDSNATVSISYTYSSLTGFFGAQFTASGKAVMRCNG